MAGWTVVADAREIAPGQGKAVDVDGRRVAVFNLNGTFYAIDDACPHRGGPLSEGEINGTTVTCPWHAAQFDILSGQHLSPPANRGVASYKVSVDGTAVRIELP
jgi:nitrite reductase (NADH) small subunit/3-phenylpropionate/trans-cinnamate dioxygenase ferredoxin subunit